MRLWRALNAKPWNLNFITTRNGRSEKFLNKEMTWTQLCFKKLKLEDNLHKGQDQWGQQSVHVVLYHNLFYQYNAW
jgi:hypothetical protein